MRFEFLQKLHFDPSKYYDVEFSYLINNDECDLDSIRIRMILYDEISFSELLFDSYYDAEIEYNQWNRRQACFEVLRNEYTLRINVTNTCNSTLSFAAIDEIRITEIEDITDKSCLKVKYTTEIDEPTLEGTVEDSTEWPAARTNKNDKTTLMLEESSTIEDSFKITPTETIDSFTSNIFSIEIQQTTTINRTFSLIINNFILILVSKTYIFIFKKS
jgi:hypothetical protein